MAKSLRSKNVLRAKSVKRNNVFQVMEDKRKQRLADKMAQELAKQEKTGSKLPEDEDAMKDDKKISTSGWRDSRNQRYKQKKSSKSKKNKTLKF